MAQVCHESGGFRYTEELADGTAYEGRSDLGNTEPGDGARFKGRGYIQVTGRYSYMRLGQYVGRDLLSFPEQVALLPLSVESAGWFWKTRGLNALADADDIVAITRKVNGGLNGISSRSEYLHRAKSVLMPTRLMPRPATPGPSGGTDLSPDVLPYNAPLLPKPDGDDEKATPEKPWWLSRTILGILLAGLSFVVKEFGVKDAWSLAADLATVGGLAWAAYGRWRAKHRLTLR